MIRITVELISAVDPTRDKVLGIAHIANIGSGYPSKADYEVKLSQWAPKQTSTWRKGRIGLQDDQLHQSIVGGIVEGFNPEKRGAWDLLYLALREIVGKRNP